MVSRAALPESVINAKTRLAAHEKRQIGLADPGQRGLQLRIMPTGVRTWVLRCSDSAGRSRRFVLGSYPKVGVAEARRLARSLREDIRKGADPIAEAKAKRAAARADHADTLGTLVELYARHKGKNLRTWPDAKRRIASVFAKSMETALPDLRLGTLQLQADQWPAQLSAAAAVRYLRPILKWAAAPGRAYVARDLTALEPPARVGRRDRVLSRDEMAKLLPVLGRPGDAYAAAHLFMLLTLTRREEAGGATWGEVDLDRAEWTIPSGRTKSYRQHVIPLSRQAVELLQTIKSNREPDTLVFSTARERLEDRLATVTNLRDRAKLETELARAAGRRLTNWDRATKRLLLDSGLATKQEKKSKGKARRVVMCDGSPMPTRHDLRRSGATMLGELGVEPHIIEAALNHMHIGGQLPALYNRARYRPQVKEALQRLADALDGITADAAIVVPLHRGLRSAE